MSGEVGGNKIAASPLSLMDVFREACPHYMAMGMTYDQFWDGDVSAHKVFRKAKKVRLSEQNEMMWLQGMYFYAALVNVAPYIKAFSKAKPKPYLNEPFDLWEEDRRHKEELAQKKRYERMKEKIALFAQAYNEKRQNTEQSKEVDENA